MFVYEVSEGEYEMYCEFHLCHKVKYDKLEFSKIIQQVLNHLKMSSHEEIPDIWDVRNELITGYGFELYEMKPQASAEVDMLNLKQL